VNEVRDRKVATAAAQAFSAAQTLRILNLRPAGGNYATLYAAIKRLNIDVSHWTGQGHLRGRRHDWARKTPLNEVLCEDSRYLGGSCKLKERLIAADLLLNHCAICKITAWIDKPLQLHLDHINGKRRDNRLENLRLLCPNCHSQTETYCGKNKRRIRERANMRRSAEASAP
jgi:5-methylcytosine-specific restriction endonuclease McrA